MSDLSLEFLMGRALDNAMLNVGQKDTAQSEIHPQSFQYEMILTMPSRGSRAAWLPHGGHHQPRA